MEIGNEIITKEVPMDIRNYKTKAIGPFTLRQIICIVIALAIDAALWFFVIPHIEAPWDVWMYVICGIDLVVVMFGWFDVEGMPLERYLTNVILPFYSCPKKRKHKRKIWTNEIVYTEKELKNAEKIRKRLAAQNKEYKGYQ